MPRGGKRPGSGRKKGSATEKTREVADRLAQGGITPLEVMLDVMRRSYEDGQFSKAADVARDAAPYVHPRLSTVQHKGVAPGSERTRIIEVLRQSTNGQPANGHA